jgi:squalene cyclase
VLSLIAAGCKDREVIDRGVKFLMSKQLPSGDWDQEGITGVFNRSCGITYTAYRNVFPIWALARYTSHYEIETKSS